MERNQTTVLMVGATLYGPVSPYPGVARTTVAPVFKMACHLRFMKPDVDMLLRRIDTQLDHGVISALIEAALRLLPPDETPEGKGERKNATKDTASTPSRNDFRRSNARLWLPISDRG